MKKEQIVEVIMTAIAIGVGVLVFSTAFTILYNAIASFF